MADLDPILVSAVRDMLAKQDVLKQQGVPITPANLDEFLKVKTNGKYGLTDAQKYLGSIDSGISARNLGRSALQGLTMNFGDEMLGALPSWLGGGEGAKEDMRLRGDLFHKQHPIADFSAGVVGAAAPALLAPELEAPNLAQGMARGALVGGAVGGLSGAGAAEGGMGERAKGAAVGAAGGALLGGLTPALAGTVKYLRDPAARATARLSHAIDQSGGIDAVKAFTQRAAAAGRGGDVMLADASDHLRGAADFAANNSDDVLFPLAKEIQKRQSNQAGRLLGDVQDLGADGDAGARKLELENGRSDFADSPQGYAGLRDQNATVDMAPLKTALSKPAVQSAWKQARLAGDITENSPLDQMLQKIMATNPHVNPATLLDAAKTGQLGTDMAKLANQGERGVTFDDLQQLRRALAGKSDAAWRSGNGVLGKAYTTIQNSVDDVLEQHVPGFKAVNAKYKGMMDLERALENGGKAFDMEDTRALARETAQLSPEELNEYRTGMASQMVTKLRSAATNRDEATKLMNASQALEDKLKLVFGDKATFDDFMSRVSVEGDMAKLKGAVSGSATARRLQSSGFDPAEIGPEAALAAVTHGPLGMVGAVKHAAAAATRAAVTRNTARELGPMLMLKGAPNIQAFLNSFQQRDPLVGSLATKYLPIAGGRAASLLDF